MERCTKEAVLTLQKEIEKEISRRKRYESLDFWLAHTFLWMSILSSFGASIIIASSGALLESPPGSNFVLAIIAGIPGLVIVIDKGFDFGKRAVWGAIYRIELELLRDELILTNQEPYEISKKFREIKMRNELAFSKIGFFAPKKDESN